MADLLIETPDMTVGILTPLKHNGNPVYSDGYAYYEVDDKGIINQVDMPISCWYKKKG